MRILLLIILVVSCGKKDDSSNGTEIEFISYHQASNSFYLHLGGKNSVAWRRMAEADFTALKNDFPFYLLNDAHENFTEEDFRLEISNPAHTNYKCINDLKLQGTANAGQTGAVVFRQLHCWQGEWY